MKLSEAIQAIHEELSPLYRQRTLRGYLSLYRSIISLTKEDCEMSEIFNPGWIVQYQLFLIEKGLKRNATSFYLRTLKSIYYKSVDRGWYIHIPNLFTRVFTGTAHTIKRAVSQSTIYQIAGARLTGPAAFARDVFMLCFYLQGMAFVDLAYLKKADMQQGYIVYCRRKTGTQISIKLRPEAIRIIRKYAPLAKKGFLFPIITHPDKDEGTQYESALRTQNRRLKIVAASLGLSQTLSTHVARHSWATIAYQNQIPVASISEALGHKSEAVTRIYLASLTREELNKANEIVMRSLRKEGRKKKGEKECPSLSKRRT